MARYEKTDEGEGKFWEITLKGLVVSTRAGKIGAGASRDRDGHLYLYDRRGRTTNREFPDVDAAKREYEKLVRAKLKEGFKLVGGELATSELIEVQRNAELEAAIIAKPEELANYLVYADWLIQRDDPRGELISMQHGMRGQADPAKFMTFKKQEEALRAKYLRSWLGDVAFGALHRLKLDWANGFVHAVRVDRPDNPTEVSLADLVKAVLASPVAIAVRELTIRGMPGEVADAVPIPPPPRLKKLRMATKSLWNVTDLGKPNGATRMREHAELYSEHDITVIQEQYSPDDAYVPARE